MFMKKAFKPRARLLKLLGDQLIGTQQLAIFELVKNSYDADADSVSILISDPENVDTASITVTDIGGEGMTLDVIQNIWLEPGADHKQIKREKGEVSKKHKRLPLGEKGVGRFAVHKLGRSIELTTKAKNSKEVYLKIDWGELEKHKYIEDAKIEIIEREPQFFKGNKTGTKIKITELNSPLDKDAVRKLHRNVESIKSPFENSRYKIDNKASTFDVELSVEGHPDWTSDLPDMQAIIGQAIFKFSFFFSEGKWTSHYEFNPNETLRKTLKVQSREVADDNQLFKFQGRAEQQKYESAIKELALKIADKEKVTEDHKAEARKQYFDGIGEVLAEIYVFDFDSEIKKYYDQFSITRKFLSENKGIRVYRDGMRVYNYGEPFDDWLEMDERRINRISKGLNRNITVGAISLDLSMATALIEKTNREGFTEDVSFLKLKSVVQTALARLEEYRFLDKERLRRLTKVDTKRSVGEFDRPIDELRSLALKKGWDDILNPVINRVEKHYNQMQDVMLHAGMAGLNMAIAFHELHHGVKDTRKIIEREEDVELVLKQFDRFELLLDTYANLLKQEKTREIDLRTLLKGNMALADVRFTMHDIITSCPILTGEQDNYSIKLPSNLITSAINNLIDNSIYWLDQRWGDEEKKKYIYIGVTDEFDKGTAIIIGDNGPGWRHISKEEMVRPFHTTKPGGMGIGLYYTNMVMEMLGGELALLDPEDLENIPSAVDGAVAALIFSGGSKCTK